MSSSLTAEIKRRLIALSRDNFNAFYQDKRFHILKESDAKRKAVLLMVADVARRRMEQALALLSIETPEKM